LECRITHLNRQRFAASIDHTMNYDCAISYIWGENPTFLQDLICDKISITKITPNVEIMLRQFRKKTESLNFRIDAICLNQTDKAKHRQQVQMMDTFN
jgi:hypothetical protein